MDFGFGGLIEAFEKYLGEKKTRNMVKGLRWGFWAGIGILILSLVEKVIDVYQVASDVIPDGPDSNTWAVWEVVEVLFSREFSILFMEEFGGILLVFVVFLILILWFRIMWLDHKIMKQFLALEELIRNPGPGRGRLHHSEQEGDQG